MCLGDGVAFYIFVYTRARTFVLLESELVTIVCFLVWMGIVLGLALLVYFRATRFAMVGKGMKIAHLLRGIGIEIDFLCFRFLVYIQLYHGREWVSQVEDVLLPLLPYWELFSLFPLPALDLDLGVALVARPRQLFSLFLVLDELPGIAPVASFVGDFLVSLVHDSDHGVALVASSRRLFSLFLVLDETPGVVLVASS